MEGFTEDVAYDLGSHGRMWLDLATVKRRRAFQTKRTAQEQVTCGRGHLAGAGVLSGSPDVGAAWHMSGGDPKCTLYSAEGKDVGQGGPGETRGPLLRPPGAGTVQTLLCAGPEAAASAEVLAGEVDKEDSDRSRLWSL